MSFGTDIKTQIENIRKEALKMGYSPKTIDGYTRIWNRYIKWSNKDIVYYNEEDYDKFLLEHYNFDVTTYSNKSKSRDQQYIRSKRMLDNFEEYNKIMKRKSLPSNLYSRYPNEWEKYLNDYVYYCKECRQNSNGTIKVKKDYLKRMLSYFYQNGCKKLHDVSQKHVVGFINHSIDKGDRSKGRYFYILKGFLTYLFIEDILSEDLSIYIPKAKRSYNKRIPTYFSMTEVDEILSVIPREKSVEKRDYAIIIIAARLGLRIHDILNIKNKDIDWVNNKITVYQSKNNNLNTLPLTKEVGWAIIDYIKNGRPITDNEYLFVKMVYPYEKMEQFTSFNKYFEKTGIEVEEDNKKGIHNLRHSLATNMLDTNTSIDIIASTLGDSIETTSNTYLRVADKQLKECVLEVNE